MKKEKLIKKDTTYHIMNKIWGLPYQDEIIDGYRIWFPEIRNPFFKDGKYEIGLNKKFLLTALSEKVNKFIIKVGQKEIYMNPPNQKELRRKDKEKEFEDRPSMFTGSPPMRIYYFKV